MNHNHEPHETGRWKTTANWVLIGFLVIGAYFLITEHRAHLFGILPFLLLLACPLMHMFMHKGHGSHGGHGGGQSQESKPPEDKPQQTQQQHH